MDEHAIENLRAYLRIPSVQPDVDYEPCLEFLRKQAGEIGLAFTVHRPVPNKPHAVLTWIGKEPTLKSIILNSHMDVVPVFAEHWTHKPFDADIDEKGTIYARGVQDDKTYGIQYLEAIRRLKRRGFRPKRTVHVTFVADEENAGLEGMRLFVKTPEFKTLNAGFALDEGVPNADDTATVCYGEKRNWKFKVRCAGRAGHGSLLMENTAGEKVERVLKKFYGFRAGEVLLPNAEEAVSVNLTVAEGGPEEFVVTFDSRVPGARFAEYEALMKKWCQEDGVTVEDVVKDGKMPYTKLDASNVFWVAFKSALESMGIQLMKPEIFSANADSRYLRGAGVPTIGYSNFFNTKITAHDHDESLSSEEFLRGIGRFEQIIPAITGA